MNLDQRIDSFAALGDFLLSPEGKQAIEGWAWRAEAHNGWFTPANTKEALDSLARGFLDKQKLSEWVAKYSLSNIKPRRVGVVMAGNIPAVGFHDMLCVLISGHQLLAKLSSQDSILLKEIAAILVKINPEWAEYIQFVERLNDAEAIIATGSDNSARYFHYYFGKKPHIIRQNRTTCAILTGNENDTDLFNLGKDVFQYFGLGCRNVSKLFVPAGYNFNHFFESIQPLDTLIQHAKYQNNYDYNKSIFLINLVPHLDNGFLMLTENTALVSPMSVVYFEEYADKAEIDSKVGIYRDKIQGIVSSQGWYPGSISFGEAQKPQLSDYADGVDTMIFLTSLAAN
ncbi:MAG: acyl-CoA reductase [Bacteroidota bacterium]